jgi:putative ABC transport system permease protein
MDNLVQDIKYALRTAVRAPGFTVVAVVALAIGIGANTAIFTIVNAVLIERLPFRDAGRLVVVWEASARRPGRTNTVGPANFLQWRDRATSFERMAAFSEGTLNLTGSGEPEQLAVQAVTPDFFPTIGVSPLVGRVFAADEGPKGRDNVAVLSHRLWQRRFGGDPTIVGRTIQLNGEAITVVGVMPPDVHLFISKGSQTGKLAELWMPFQFTPEQRQPRGRYLTAIARLKPAVPLATAQTEMRAIASALAAEWPEFDTGWTVKLVPLRDELSGDLRPALAVLSGAVAIVLLIACANVANLLLARGAVRAREIAIRTALGAARRRVVRQLLTESLVLGMVGGLAGLFVARWGLDFLVALSPVDLNQLGDLHLSYPVLGFTALVSMATAAICGFAPAIEGSRGDVQETLKDGARQAGSSVRARRLRHGFVVAEIALAVVLLVGAGLFLRSFAALRSLNPGFDARNVLTMRVSLPFAKYGQPEQRLRFFREAVARITAVPGVQRAGAVSFLPFAALGAATNFTIEGRPEPLPGQSPVTDVRVCDNGFFATLGIPLVHGRLFTDREMQTTSNVVVINEALARQYFPGEDPIGKSLTIAMFDPIVPTAIVGVVGDAHYADLTTAPRAMVYWPHPQLAYGSMTLAIRTAQAPMSVASAAEHAIQTLDKDQPVSDVRTMDQWIGTSLAQTRFSTTLLSIFAGVALLLAAIGIYGVMSYAVSQRTSEIGIRLALGAEERDILRLIVGQALRLAAAGLAIGVLLALALGGTITSLLYGTSGADAATFIAVVACLGGVALAAGYLPARRASRIAPVEALRYH